MPHRILVLCGAVLCQEGCPCVSGNMVVGGRRQAAGGLDCNATLNAEIGLCLTCGCLPADSVVMVVGHKKLDPNLTDRPDCASRSISMRAFSRQATWLWWRATRGWTGGWRQGV